MLFKACWKSQYHSI